VIAVVAGALVLLALLLFVGRTVDHWRGVSIAGIHVENAATNVHELATGFGATKVVVHTPAGAIRATAAEFGMSVDEPATIAAIEDARDSMPMEWLRGLVHRRSAAVIVRVDTDITRSLLHARDPNERKEPVEPAVVGSEDGIGVRQGKPGSGLSIDEVAAALHDGARHAKGTIEVDVEPIPLAPRFTLAQAERLARRARRITDTSLSVSAGSDSAELSPRVLRSWVRSTDDLKLTLDHDAALRDLGRTLTVASVEPVDATVRIADGHPVVVPAVTGTRCCSDAAPDRILAALQHPPSTPLSLPLTVKEPDRTTEEVESLRITEVIGTFTTRHQRGQPRVTNIHHIADTVNGTIIEPGKRLSINELVGERTTEKGYVVDHAISNGKFIETVGGGVSQFATTLFNAAFFGGLDIPVYQSHSLYISRYPYGREATLSWPKPDLVIHNTTPYGVLIEASYTSSSVTVTLWSTRFATGEQTNQSQAPSGNCTRVTTERTRTYVDGHTTIDHVYATYRPEEGAQC
jgi:vancomycin resistance protein YoaR